VTGSNLRCLGALLVSIIVLTPSPTVGQEIFAADSGLVLELKELVRRTNPELQARTALLKAAKARARAAGSYGPVALSTEVEEIPDGVNVGEAGSLRLDLSRELFSGGLLTARRRLAAAEVERSQRELALAQRSLLARVDGAVVHYLGGLAVAHRLAAQDSLLAGAQDAVTSRFAVGGARYVDVIRLRTERLRTQVELAQAKTEALEGRRRLVGLVAPDDSVIASLSASLERLTGRVSITLERFSFPPPPALDSLVAQSASIQLAEVAVSQAEAGVGLALAARRTRLSGSLGVQRFADDAGGHAIGPTLGMSMTLPFTAPNAGRATREAAEQELRASQAERRGALGRTTALLGAARDQYETALANVRLFEAALLQGAREERENALAGYRTGSLSLVELLDFERALTQAEISRTRSVVAAGEALAELLAGAFEVPEHGQTATDFGGGDL